MSVFLKKLFTQTTENESESGKKLNHVVVEIEIAEHEYMAFDSDDEMVESESFVFNGDDSPGFIRITVDGNEIEFDEDTLSDRSKYSDYESFDLETKWNSDDIVKFGYYDNLAGKTWEFDVENFDIEKMSFYYQCFDVKFGPADYDCEEHRITLRYAGEEIEEDYDAYSCENGEFEQEWCLYDDEDCCDDDDSNNSEDDDESSIDSVSRVFGILAFKAANLDDVVTEEEVGAIIGIANSFGLNVDLVKQAVMLEKMGIRSYDNQSELAVSIPEEYYDNVFQGIIMVLIADFKLRQAELDFLSGLKDIWRLDDDYVDDVLNYHVQRLRARHPEREFEVEGETKGEDQVYRHLSSEENRMIEQKNDLQNEVYEEPQLDYILIKVRSTVLEDNNNNLYETVRKAWRADINKAKKYNYVLAVVDGVVRNVYTQLNWYDSSIKGRIEFEGKECSEDWTKDLLDKKIPAQYRQKGAANPFMYKK